MIEKKRASDVNQQIGLAVRPQLPRDGSKGGVNYHVSGKLPPSGYTSTWNFNGNKNTKDASTTKPGNAGGKDIC